MNKRTIRAGKKGNCLDNYVIALLYFNHTYLTKLSNKHIMISYREYIPTKIDGHIFRTAVSMQFFVYFQAKKSFPIFLFACEDWDGGGGGGGISLSYVSKNFLVKTRFLVKQKK